MDKMVQLAIEPKLPQCHHAVSVLRLSVPLLPCFEPKFLRFLSFFRSGVSLMGSGVGICCDYRPWRGQRYSSRIDSRAVLFSQHKLHADVSLCAHPTDMEQEEPRRFETVEIHGLFSCQIIGEMFGSQVLRLPLRLRPLTASNCCYRVRRGAPKWYVSVFLTNQWYVVVCFCQFTSNHCVGQLCRSAISTNTPCGVRYVACHVQVALLLSFVGPPWCQWCSDWCALGCSATVAFGCVCSSHVSGWLTSVEVFAAVPLGVSCFLSCWVGGYFVAR